MPHFIRLHLTTLDERSKVGRKREPATGSEHLLVGMKIAIPVLLSIGRHVHENFKISVFSTKWCQIERYCDSLQNEGSTTWNGEETEKLWVKNESWTIPRNCDLAVPIDLCTFLCVKAHFFHHKGAFNKNALLFLEIWLLLAEMYCPKV